MQIRPFREQDGRVVACAVDGHEGHRGWVNDLAVDH